MVAESGGGGCLRRGRFHSLKSFPVTWTTEASATTGRANGSRERSEKLPQVCRGSVDGFCSGWYAEIGFFQYFSCCVRFVLQRRARDIHPSIFYHVSQLYEPIIFAININLLFCEGCAPPNRRRREGKPTNEGEKTITQKLDTTQLKSFV